METDLHLTMKIATPDDALHLAHLNLLFNQCDEAPDAYAARLANPQRVDTPILALRGVLAIGVANLRLVQPVFYPQPYAEVTELFVLESYRRQGVGRRLLAFAEQLARNAGAEEILVLTDLTNQAAISLYQSCGYEDQDLALTKSLV